MAIKQRTVARKEPVNKIITREDELKIIDAYLEGKSCEYIRVHILDCKVKTDKSVADALKRLGMYQERSKAFYSQTKNHNYFNEIDTEEKAYFLGLMQSDGWLHAKSDNSKQIGLCLEEDYIIEKFKSELQTENKVVVRAYNDHRKTLYQLQVDSAVLYKDLYNLGVGDKFNDQYMPVLREDLYNHYIRGLFDGDGTVCPHEETKNIHIGLLGGYRSMSQVSFYLAYKLGIFQTQPAICNNKCFNDTNKKLYSLRFADSREVETIFNFLYKNATVYIKRKHDVFMEYFNG